MHVPLRRVKLMEKRESIFYTLAINYHTAEQKIHTGLRGT